MITQAQKQIIVNGIRSFIKMKEISQNKAAKIFGISAAQLSRILKGEIDRVIGDDKFLSIARKLSLSLKPGTDWVTARTETYTYIYTQLGEVQKMSTSGLLVDKADIGKTYTAKQYVMNNKNAIYIDCSQAKSKQRLIRKIAKEFGLDSSGKYNDVFETLIFYLNNAIVEPLIILDEAGDLDYSAFLELKSIWNATENNVAWYMMGADGLRVKIERFLAQKKVGYAEIFSRFGNKFQKISPESQQELKEFNLGQIAMIAKANGVSDIIDVYAKSEGSLRRLFHEIKKIK